MYIFFSNVRMIVFRYIIMAMIMLLVDDDSVIFWLRQGSTSNADNYKVNDKENIFKNHQ